MSLRATTLLAKRGIRRDLVGEFTHGLTPGCLSLPPNGQRVRLDLLNIFRFDDQGRMIEEWVRTDYRSFLRAARGRRESDNAHNPRRRRNRTVHLLALMQKGDDAFDARRLRDDGHGT